MILLSKVYGKRNMQERGLEVFARARQRNKKEEKNSPTLKKMNSNFSFAQEDEKKNSDKPRGAAIDRMIKLKRNQSINTELMRMPSELSATSCAPKYKWTALKKKLRKFDL